MKEINYEDLIPVYQAILDVKTGEVIGFEANTRGIVNGKELIYPDLKKEKFINLDFDARDKAIKSFELLNRYKLFVNATPEEMSKPLFFEDIDKSRIVLEITEDSVVDPNKRQRLLDRLRVLRKEGLTIALDDFGAENANLDKIPVFNPTFIKIDKEVAKEKELVGIIKGIIEQPEYKVIIEGIEEFKDLIEWKELGARYFQGFLISRQLKYGELTNAIATGKLFDNIQENIMSKIPVPNITE